jgi:hypothetical protein
MFVVGAARVNSADTRCASLLPETAMPDAESDRAQPAPSSFNDVVRERVVQLRRALLHLHKALLQWERDRLERVQGRVSSGDLLQLTL